MLWLREVLKKARATLEIENDLQVSTEKAIDERRRKSLEDILWVTRIHGEKQSKNNFSYHFTSLQHQCQAAGDECGVIIQ